MRTKNRKTLKRKKLRGGYGDDVCGYFDHNKDEEAKLYLQCKKGFPDTLYNFNKKEEKKYEDFIIWLQEQKSSQNSRKSLKRKSSKSQSKRKKSKEDPFKELLNFRDSSW